MKFYFYQIVNFIRISAILFFFYAYIVPFAFPFLKRRELMERVVFSFIFFNGLFLFLGPLFVEARFIDIPGFVVVLIFIAVFPTLWKNKGNLLPLIQRIEREAVLGIVRALEKKHRQNKSWFSSFTIEKISYRFYSIIRNEMFWIFIITAGIYQIMGMLHPAPFNKEWFDYIIGIKNIQLAKIWIPYLVDRGFLLLAYFWAILTHSEPEILLHMGGSILWGFTMISMAYFWKKNFQSHPALIIMAVILFSFLPDVISFIYVEKHIYLNADLLVFTYLILLLYLSFQLNLLSTREKFWLFLLIQISFGMINLFFYLFVVLPLSFLLYFSTHHRSSIIKATFSSAILVLVHLVMYQIFSGQNLIRFVRTNLFNPEKFTLFEHFLFPIAKLPMVIGIIIGLLLFSQIFIFRKYTASWKIAVVFGLSGILFLIPFLPQTNLAYRYVDVDQLIFVFNLYFLFFILLLFELIYRFIKLFKLKFLWETAVLIVLTLLVTSPLIQRQIKAGFKPAIDLGLPDNFYREYYTLITDHLPFSYAIVAPPINYILAQNRHYYMNYNYFLTEYGKIDSLYHDVLLVYGEKKTKLKRIPPPSIFVFVVKSTVQKNISAYFYPGVSTMQRIVQWIDKYKSMKNRKVELFYEDKNYIIYKIVNIPGKSAIWDLLWDMK